MAIQSGLMLIVFHIKSVTAYPGSGGHSFLDIVKTQLSVMSAGRTL